MVSSNLYDAHEVLVATLASRILGMSLASEFLRTSQRFATYASVLPLPRYVVLVFFFPFCFCESALHGHDNIRGI